MAPSRMQRDQMDEIERELKKQIQIDAEKKKRQDEARRALDSVAEQIEREGHRTAVRPNLGSDPATERTLKALTQVYKGSTMAMDAGELTPEQMVMEERLKAAQEESEEAQATLDHLVKLADPKVAQEMEAKKILDRAERELREESEGKAAAVKAMKEKQDEALSQLDMVADAMQRQASKALPSDEEKQKYLDEIAAHVQSGALGGKKHEEVAKKALDDECARLEKELRAGGYEQLSMDAEMEKEQEQKRIQAEQELELEKQRVIEALESEAVRKAKVVREKLDLEDEASRVMDELARELGLGDGFEEDLPVPKPKKRKPVRRAARHRLMASVNTDSVEGRILKVLIALAGLSSARVVDTGSKVVSVLVDGYEVEGLHTVCRTLGMAASPSLYPTSTPEVLITVDAALQDAFELLGLVGAVRREAERTLGSGGVVWRTLTWPLRLAVWGTGAAELEAAVEKLVLALRRVDGVYFQTQTGEFMATDTPSVADAVLAVVVEELVCLGLDTSSLRLRHLAYFWSAIGANEGYQGLAPVVQKTDQQSKAKVIRGAAQARGFARRD